MSDLGMRRAQQDALHRSADLGHSTRYSEAVHRYLAASAHHLDELPRRSPEPRSSPATAPAATGLVLVAVDESPISYTAVDHAAIEAELRGWDLRILHVQHTGGRREPARDAGARLLERLTDRVHACSPSVAVTSRLAVGSACPLVLFEAHDADLVVVGHRHGVAGAALGVSVGDRVAAEHTGAVLVVRVPGWPPGPGFGQRPLVVGVDRGETPTPALDFALQEAHVRGCELVMLYADPDVAPSGRAETLDGVLVHHRTVSADPPTALIDFSNRAAAVVAGRRASGRGPRGSLGSASRTLVQHAYCPVFLVG